jgi:hypothetical protein
MAMCAVSQEFRADANERHRIASLGGKQRPMEFMSYPTKTVTYCPRQKP